MFTKKSPLSKNAKQNSVDPGFPGYSSPNPFDSDDESGAKKSLNPAQRSNSEPTLVNSHLGTHSSDNDERNRNSSSSYSLTYSSRNRYKNDFHDAGGLENQNVQELENYAVYKAEETTTTVKSCLKIAEDMREDATRTLANLHQQGEQITRSHMVAADLDHDLSRVWLLHIFYSTSLLKICEVYKATYFHPLFVHGCAPFESLFMQIYDIALSLVQKSTSLNASEFHYTVSVYEGCAKAISQV